MDEITIVLDPPPSPPDAGVVVFDHPMTVTWPSGDGPVKKLGPPMINTSDGVPELDPGEAVELGLAPDTIELAWSGVIVSVLVLLGDAPDAAGDDSAGGDPDSAGGDPDAAGDDSAGGDPDSAGGDPDSAGDDPDAAGDDSPDPDPEAEERTISPRASGLLSRKTMVGPARILFMARSTGLFMSGLPSLVTHIATGPVMLAGTTHSLKGSAIAKGRPPAII